VTVDQVGGVPVTAAAYSTKPIVWESGRYSSRSGSIGGIRIWWCSYVDASRCLLDCGLPGIKRRVEVESYEAGEERAQKQLAVFLSKLLLEEK
jgi:hypothetical protein